jgi:hypothetical protein
VNTAAPEPRTHLKSQVEKRMSQGSSHRIQANYLLVSSKPPMNGATPGTSHFSHMVSTIP